MKNIKLIRLLKTFSTSEFQDFGKFVNSPFHNESPKSILLYDILKKYYPDFDDHRLNKENVYKKIYGDSEFDDKKVRDRFSDMLKLAEEYLAIIDIKGNPVTYKRHVLRQLSDRRLAIHFEKKYKEIQSILDKTEIRNTNFFQNMYLQLRDRIDFYENIPLLGKRKPVYDEVGAEVMYFLKFFTAEMLTYFTVMYNWEGGLNYKFDYIFYEPVIKFVEENNLNEYPLIKAFYLILKLKENSEDDNRYYELKELYIKSADLFDQRDKIFIGTILFNEALARSMKEKPGFDIESFEIMKLQLEHDSYPKEDGWLSREQYLNYVIIPVNIGDLEWAEGFIDKYTVNVAPDKRENAFLYVSALLHYSQKKYDLALSELVKIKGGDYVYHVRIKMLSSRIYFDIKDYEKVLSILDSFRHYITSNPLTPEYVIKRYTNYISILQKLTMLSVTRDEYSMLKLVEEIKRYSIDDITTNKPWLMEKALKLKDNIK